MAELRQIFIENLKHYRKQNNLRQLDLALEIGKSSNYINSIENGKYFPSPETIDKIATVLKIDPQKLFDGSVIEKAKKSELNKEALAKEIFSKIKLQIDELIEKELKVALRETE